MARKINWNRLRANYYIDWLPFETQMKVSVAVKLMETKDAGMMDDDEKALVLDTIAILEEIAKVLV